MAIPVQLIDGIDRLEPLPPTVQKLVLALNGDEIDFGEVASAIEFDPAVTSNVLRIANSPVYGGRAPIQHIRDAVLRLGSANLLNLVLLGHFRTLKIRAPLYDLSEGDLFLHGAAASLAVKALMQEAQAARIPNLAGIAALIHDIGKIIMVRYLDADVTAILALCREKRISFVDAERELFSCDHAQVGGAMAERWRFPDAVTHAISRHHEDAASDSNPVLDAVILANIAAKSVGVGLGAEGFNLRVDTAGSRERLSLSLAGFERVCAQTAFWLKDLRQTYGFKN